MGKRILDMGKDMNFGPKSSYRQIVFSTSLDNPYRIIFNWVVGVNKYKNDVDHKCCFWKFGMFLENHIPIFRRKIFYDNNKNIINITHKRLK